MSIYVKEKFLKHAESPILLNTVINYLNNDIERMFITFPSWRAERNNEYAK